MVTKKPFLRFLYLDVTNMSKNNGKIKDNQRGKAFGGGVSLGYSKTYYTKPFLAPNDVSN